MRFDFDSSVLPAEALARRNKISTGRKHMHRIGPGRRQKPKPSGPTKEQRAYAKAVRAYWSGESDEHP